MSDIFRGYATSILREEDTVETVRQGPFANTEWRDVEVSTVRTVSLRGAVAGKLYAGEIDLEAPYMNPVITGWELIPFSWVVDYFVGVGGALKAALTLMQMREFTSAYGIYETYHRSYVIVGTGHGSALISYQASGSGAISGQRKLRVPHGMSLKPVTGLPSKHQWYNIIALLTQKINPNTLRKFSVH
jgi:hypothetical protein